MGEDEHQQEQDDAKPRSTFMVLSEQKFLLQQPESVVPAAEKEELRALLLAAVEKDGMVSFYRHVAAEEKWEVDEALCARLAEANAARLAELDEAIAEAKKNAGDTEVREATLARAEHLARTAGKKEATEAYEQTFEVTVGAGLKIDLVLSLVRLGFLYGDSALVRDQIARAKALTEDGGDWERRNLLKIYEAAHLVSVREVRRAASLLLESVATFTCTELFDYNTFVFYTALAAVVSVDRNTLRDKVLRAPEVLSAYHDMPHLQGFLESLFECRYRDFLASLAEIMPLVQRDRFFAPHFSYLMREVRVVVYRQYLQAYRSVKLASMAEAFGLSSEFLDRELSRFISVGRLNCKIDKVNGIVETNRPDRKNGQYQDTLKQGDILLQRIQRLTKVVNY